MHKKSPTIQTIFLVVVSLIVLSRCTTTKGYRKNAALDQYLVQKKKVAVLPMDIKFV